MPITPQQLAAFNSRSNRKLYEMNAHLPNLSNDEVLMAKVAIRNAFDIERNTTLSIALITLSEKIGLDNNFVQEMKNDYSLTK
jgi:hypothetical protein